MTAHPSFSPSHLTDLPRRQLPSHETSEQKESTRDEGSRSGVGHPELREGERQERSWRGGVGSGLGFRVRVGLDEEAMAQGFDGLEGIGSTAAWVDEEGGNGKCGDCSWNNGEAGVGVGTLEVDAKTSLTGRNGVRRSIAGGSVG